MTMVEYAQRFIGRPYVWGGDGTGLKYGGFDCSGLVLECLWAFGKYKGKDTTAEGLRKYCKQNGVGIEHQYERPGDIVFFGRNGRASHVAIAIGEGLMIEAGGGGSKCKTLLESTGMVRVRPISSRSDFMEAWSL